MAIKGTTKRAEDIASYVKRQFGDEAGVQVTDTDILRWINNGQLEIVAANNILREKATTALIKGQTVYDFPMEKVLSVDAIHVDGVPVQHMQFPEAEKYINTQDPKRTQEGQPLYWYDYGNQITFWPKPAQDLENGIVVFYVKEPDQVTSVNDLISIPDKYYNSLVKYVLAQAYEMDEDWQAARTKSEQFREDLAEFAEQDVSLSSQSYPTITFL